MFYKTIWAKTINNMRFFKKEIYFHKLTKIAMIKGIKNWWMAHLAHFVTRELNLIYNKVKIKKIQIW